jgi:hypothetical protein
METLYWIGIHRGLRDKLEERLMKAYGADLKKPWKLEDIDKAMEIKFEWLWFETTMEAEMVGNSDTKYSEFGDTELSDT